MDVFTTRVALYEDKAYGIKHLVEARYINLYADKPNEIRLTEFTEITMQPRARDAVVADQIAALDMQADKLREALEKVKEQRANLLALPAPDNRGPDEPDPYLYGDEDTGEDCNVEVSQ